MSHVHGPISPACLPDLCKVSNREFCRFCGLTTLSGTDVGGADGTPVFRKFRKAACPEQKAAETAIKHYKKFPGAVRDHEAVASSIAAFLTNDIWQAICSL